MSFARTMDRRLDMLLTRIMGACFLAVAAAHVVEGVRLYTTSKEHRLSVAWMTLDLHEVAPCRTVPDVSSQHSGRIRRARCTVALVTNAGIAAVQRSAAQPMPGKPAASRLNAGLLGWNLGLIPIYLIHADALNSFGFK